MQGISEMSTLVANSYYHRPGLHPDQLEVADSHSYAATTHPQSGGGRSLHAEHLRLYQQENDIIPNGTEKNE